ATRPTGPNHPLDAASARNSTTPRSVTPPPVQASTRAPDIRGRRGARGPPPWSAGAWARPPTPHGPGRPRAGCAAGAHGTGAGRGGAAGIPSVPAAPTASAPRSRRSSPLSASTRLASRSSSATTARYGSVPMPEASVRGHARVLRSATGVRSRTDNGGRGGRRASTDRRIDAAEWRRPAAPRAGTRPGDRVAPRGGSRHERATRPARQGDPKPGGNRSRLPCVIKNVTTVQRATTTRSGRPYGRPAPRPPQPARAGFVVL